MLENFIPMQDALKMVLESPAEVLVAIDPQHPNIICTHHHGARLVKGYQGQVPNPPRSPTLAPCTDCIQTSLPSLLQAADALIASAQLICSPMRKQPGKS